MIFNGVAVDPRYRFRNETLISTKWLGVTEEEQKHMSTIIGKEEARKRAAERSRKQRAEQGAQTLAERKESVAERKNHAIQLREKGLTWSAIAKELGYSSAKSVQTVCSR